MGELFKTQHTIDEMLDRMGVKIVLDSEHLTEEDKFEAEKQGSSVVLKKSRKEGYRGKGIRSIEKAGLEGLLFLWKFHWNNHSVL